MRSLVGKVRLKPRLTFCVRTYARQFEAKGGGISVSNRTISEYYRHRKVVECWLEPSMQ